MRTVNRLTSRKVKNSKPKPNKQKGVLSGQRIDRQLIRASHEFNISDLTDEELDQHLSDIRERQREEQRALCDGARKDPSIVSVQELWELQDAERRAEAEQRAFLQARELNPAPPHERPRVYTGPSVKLPRLINGKAVSQNGSPVDLRRPR